MLETVQMLLGADTALIATWHANDVAALVEPATAPAKLRMATLAHAEVESLHATLTAVAPSSTLYNLAKELLAPGADLDAAGELAAFVYCIGEHPTTPAAESRQHNAWIFLWRDMPAVRHAVLDVVVPLLPRFAAIRAETRRGAIAARRLDAIMQSATQGIVFVDAASDTAHVNAIAAKLLQLPDGNVGAEALSAAVRTLHDRLDDRHRVVDEYTRLMLSDACSEPDWVWEFVSPSPCTWRVATVPVGERPHHGRLWIFEDVTDDRALQRQVARQFEREQTLQRQKLEALMRLAGGVAHDFTNLLTVISGSVEMMHDLPIGREADADLSAIRQATQKANVLLRQLRAFSGHAVAQPDILLVDTVVRATQASLNAALDPPWRLVIEPDAQGALILMNERQFALALLHLLERMRDHMVDGGTIALRTKRVILEHAPSTGARGDPYVMLWFCDGSEPATLTTPNSRDAIVELRTRAPDDTGLGQATISAIVEQAAGFTRNMTLASGRRVMTLYLPESTVRSSPQLERTPARGTPIGGHKHELPMLVVDDDAGPRRVVRRLLEREGYHVLVADSAVDAIRQLSARGGQLCGVISDYLMPGMSGMQLLTKVRRTWPSLPVVLVSGFTSDEVTGTALRELRAHFLPKPFTRDELLMAIDAASMAIGTSETAR